MNRSGGQYINCAINKSESMKKGNNQIKRLASNQANK